MTWYLRSQACLSAGSSVLTLGELRAVLGDPDVVDMPDCAEVECHIDPMSQFQLTIRWDDERGVVL